MTFRGNARIFSIQTRSWTAILGRREHTFFAFNKKNHLLPALILTGSILSGRAGVFENMNKSSGAVLLEYGTGHCLRTVVNDKVTSRLLHICVLAIEIGKRIRSQLKQRDANTLFRIAFSFTFYQVATLE